MNAMIGRSLIALALVALPGAVAGARAELLVSYSTAGLPSGSTSVAAAGVAAGLSAGDLKIGPGLSTPAAGTTGTLTATGFPTLAQSFDINADYFTFSVTPVANTTFDLSDLSLVQRANSAGPASFQVRTSLDGFAAAIGGTQTTSKGTAWVEKVVGFGASFSGLTTPVEFRVYGFNSSLSGGSFQLSDSGRLPAVTLNGTVRAAQAVPEPSTVALLAVGIVAVVPLARWGRRRA